MNYARLKSSLQKAGFYFPVTLYFLTFSIVTLFAWRWLHVNPLQADTAFGSIFELLLKVAVWFGIIMLAFALLSVVVSGSYFIYHRKKGIIVNIATGLKESELHQKQAVHVKIAPVLKPFLGFIKLRLQYDDNRFSKKFSLLETNRRKFFSREIDGIYHWPLPQIKEYTVDKAILYFEDIFQFFSIAFDLPAHSNFFTHPLLKQMENLGAMPRKTEETNTRIPELRKLEGEYLNYKNFENNDDVRRIVWKIYAKNKELVVRVPEIMDPYASHVYIYASFYRLFGTEGNTVAEVPFLNYYKTMAWTVYQTLVKKGLEVRYIPDQDVSRINNSDEQNRVKHTISISRWHRDKELKNYVHTKDASVVLISSFSDVDEVRQLAEQHGNDISFVFIKLTDSLRSLTVIDWIQWLFIKNEVADMDAYRRAWMLSPLRNKVLNNEKQLEGIINKYTNGKMVESSTRRS